MTSAVTSQWEGDGPHPTRPHALDGAVELAQVCHFCASFGAALKLPAFTRTELQAALIAGVDGDDQQLMLLAELHFKLAREQSNLKMDKMLQDWEKTVARKVGEHWRLEFDENPFEGGASYGDLSHMQRVQVLNALCHWKLESSSELHNHLVAVLKENDTNAMATLRADPIGYDDAGVVYWYFDDGCWVYAEDRAAWQLESIRTYTVEYADAKRIRLSLNFIDGAITNEQSMEENVVSKIESAGNDDAKVSADISTSGGKMNIMMLVNGDMGTGSPSMDEAKQQEATMTPPVTNNGDTSKATVDPTAVKVEPQSDMKKEPRKMDIHMLCGDSPGTSEEEIRPKQEPSKVENLGDSVVNAEDECATHDGLAENAEVVPDVKLLKQETVIISGTESPGTTASDTIHNGVVSVKESADENGDDKPHKNKDARPTVSFESNTTLLHQSKKKRPLELVGQEERGGTESGDKTRSPNQEQKKIRLVAPTEAEVAVKRNGGEASDTIKSKTDVAANEASTDVATVPTTNGDNGDPKSESSLAMVNGISVLVTAEENYDVLCQACNRSYDMRYLDPPLEKRPSGDWRCFECLVNDARGWPRRRPLSRRRSSSAVDTAAGPEKSIASKSPKSRKRSSSSISTSNASKTSSSKRTSSRASSGGSRSSSRHKKGSGGNSHSHGSSSKKSSSSRKSKKKKSSSSSSSRRHSSSTSGSSRHHHHHQHRESYAHLLQVYHGRKRDRVAIENERLSYGSYGYHESVPLEGPTGWRVVSSSVETLRELVETLLNGSLEQERLRSRLILILKHQEKQEEQRARKRALMWQALPRRQSSRVAIGRIKYQTAGSGGGEDSDHSDDERTASRSDSKRATRSAPGHGSDGGGQGRQQLASERESRARRRQIIPPINEDDSEDEKSDDEMEKPSSPPSVKGWIDWSQMAKEKRLTTVCRAAINRLLEEEMSNLFARPVDPVEDDCPDYLTVIEHPIDLGTIRERLDTSFYGTWEVFKADVNRVWKNCRAYNSADTVVVHYANLLDKMFNTMRKEAERKGIRKTSDSTVYDTTDWHDPTGDDVANDVSSDGGSDADWSNIKSSKPGAGSDSSASEHSSEDESDDDAGNSSGGSSDDMRARRGKRRTRQNPRSTPRRGSQSNNNSSTRKSSRRVGSTRSNRRRVSDDESIADSDADSESEDTWDSDGSTEPSRTRGSKRVTAPVAPPPPPSTDPPPPPPTSLPPREPSRGNRNRNVIRSSDSSSSEESDAESSSDDDDHEAEGVDDDLDAKSLPAVSSRASSIVEPPSNDGQEKPALASIVVPPPQSPPPVSIAETVTPTSHRRKRSAPSGGLLSPSLLNPYQSPGGSSSSSYFSSSESDSSGGQGGGDDSDSD